MSKIVDWIKEHPYESGALVLVLAGGGYLILSSGSSASAGASTASGTNSADYYSAQLQLDQLNAAQSQQQLQAQTQLQQTSIAAGVQDNQVAAQLQAVQIQSTAAIQAAGIQAGVTNNQTQAQVDVATIQGNVQNTQTAAAVSENHDNLAAVLGLVSAQDQVQINQQNDAVQQAANNDQTALDLNGQQYDYITNVATLQAGVNTTELNDATAVETNAQANQLKLAQTIIPLAGQQKNSALDATDQTNLFQTILTGGNPTVATAGVGGTTAADASGNNQLSSTITALSPVSKSLLGMFA